MAGGSCKLKIRLYSTQLGQIIFHFSVRHMYCRNYANAGKLLVKANKQFSTPVTVFSKIGHISASVCYLPFEWILQATILDHQNILEVFIV